MAALHASTLLCGIPRVRPGIQIVHNQKRGWIPADVLAVVDPILGGALAEEFPVADGLESRPTTPLSLRH